MIYIRNQNDRSITDGGQHSCAQVFKQASGRCGLNQRQRDEILFQALAHTRCWYLDMSRHSPGPTLLSFINLSYMFMLVYYLYVYFYIHVSFFKGNFKYRMWYIFCFATPYYFFPVFIHIFWVLGNPGGDIRMKLGFISSSDEILVFTKGKLGKFIFQCGLRIGKYTLIRII